MSDSPIIRTPTGRSMFRLASQATVRITRKQIAAIEREAVAAFAADIEGLRLDADEWESIGLALGQLPTWFPETAAKVEAIRALLHTVASEPTGGTE